MDKLLMLILATWRLSHLLTNEDGPYDIAAKARHLAGVRYDIRNEPVTDTQLAKLVMCMYCNSVWIGGLFTLLWLIRPKLALTAAAPFALSAGALLLEEKRV